MIPEKFKTDLRLSIEIVWIIFSVIILGIIMMSYFLPETLLKLSPVCISKSRFGTECFMCGMTRAFMEISRGNLYSALTLNGLSIFLFSMFVLNTLTFVSYLISKIGKIKPVIILKKLNK